MAPPSVTGGGNLVLVGVLRVTGMEPDRDKRCFEIHAVKTQCTPMKLTMISGFSKSSVGVMSLMKSCWLSARIAMTNGAGGTRRVAR